MSDLRQKNLRDYSGFKVTPTGWTEKTVGEICNLGRGRVISQEEINENPGPYPVFSSQTRNNGQMGSLTTFDFFGEYITWTTDGENAGTVFFRSGQFNCTNVCGTLQPKNKDDLELQFLAYHLGRIAKRYVSYIGNPKLMNGVMASIGLILPSRNVQARIAEILSSVDRAIAHTEALIEKYQQIKAGLMHDLFTRGIGADGKLRPPRDEAPELYQESAIGWIPREWDCMPIERYVESAQYGISTSLSNEKIGIPVLRMNNIQDNAFDVSDIKYASNPDAYNLKLKKGDVLYNRTNSMEHVGKTAIWRDELAECSFASYLVRINLYKDKMLPHFFSYWMSQVSSQNALRRYATPGVQQVNINPTNLQKILITCPRDLEEQRRVIERIDSIELKLQTEKIALRKYYKEKSGLMQDLLTGKVPVKVDSDEVDHISN